MNTLNTQSIAFIGAGNMAKAIIQGLLKQGVNTQHIKVSAPSQASRNEITSIFDLATTANNADICSDANIIILCVKPQKMQEACASIRAELKHQPLVISVAAGITTADLCEWLGINSVVRSMPNTPSAIGKGATGYYCCDSVNTEQKNTAHAIFSSIGMAVDVDDEAQLNAITAISGSSPAYFFYFLEAMIEAGMQLGLHEKTATQLAVQSAKGAASLAAEAINSDATHEAIHSLRRKVTSPNGTTERAIATFDEHQLKKSILNAMQACYDRAETLAEELSASK